MQSLVYRDVCTLTLLAAIIITNKLIPLCKKVLYLMSILDGRIGVWNLIWFIEARTFLAGHLHMFWPFCHNKKWQKGIFYGYMRVSTVEQNIERQKVELLRWGIIDKNIFCDKLSGSRKQRVLLSLRRRASAWDAFLLLFRKRFTPFIKNGKLVYSRWKLQTKNQVSR